MPSGESQVIHDARMVPDYRRLKPGLPPCFSLWDMMGSLPLAISFSCFEIDSKLVVVVHAFNPHHSGRGRQLSKFQDSQRYTKKKKHLKQTKTTTKNSVKVSGKCFVN